MRVSKIKYDGDYETYQIHGGEAISIGLMKGDSVEVVDVEGDQNCSVLAFDSKKVSSLSSLNWRTKPNKKIHKSSSKDCSIALKEVLNSNQISSKELNSTELFSVSSPAESRQSFYICLLYTSPSPRDS